LLHQCEFPSPLEGEGQGGGCRRTISLCALVLATDGQPAAVTEPKRREPTDAFIRELHAIYSMRSATGRVVDEGLIKQRLLRTSDGVLGKGVVHAILVKRLVEQQ
jgi:hypothetical protein